MTGRDFGRAVELLDALSEALPQQRGPQRWRLLDAILRSTSVLHTGMQAGDANRIAQAAVNSAVSSSGRLRSDDLDVLSSLADDLHRDKKCIEATRLLSAVAEVRRQIQGNEHPDTLSSMNKLALWFRDQGALTKARALLERVLDSSHRVLGAEHPDTLVAASNLAAIESGRLGAVSEDVRASFDPVMKALGQVRQELSTVKDVITVRPGYGYPQTGNPVPALVVAVTPGTTPVRASELQQKYGVAVNVTEATVEEQQAAARREGPASFSLPQGSEATTFERLLDNEEAVEFAPPKSGSYEELDPPDLPLVKEKMDLTICVSPEAGWSELQTFLTDTQKRLTVAMYQFTAPHIFQAVRAAVEPPGRQFELILHPVPEKPAKWGVKAHDLDEESGVIEPLEKNLKDRFDMAWATLVSNDHPDGLWDSAYHIKVAVRDGSAVWLSSGNWQSSNQPDVHPFVANAEPLPAGFQRKYNRDYHAIVVNQLTKDDSDEASAYRLQHFR